MNTSSDDPVDITPDASVVPVYLDPTGGEPLPTPMPSPDEAAAERQVARDAGIAKLVALGLTEAEALALAGGGA